MTQDILARARAGARRGSASSYFDLGIFYSTGSHGVAVDMVEAHRWFNLAALAGRHDAQASRADISAEMSRAEIAMAQALARDWLNRSARTAPRLARAA